MAALALLPATAAVAAPPDGRAYELVSPGGLAAAQGNRDMLPDEDSGTPTQISLSGDRVVMGGKGAFAGAPGGSLIPNYLGMRDPTLPTWVSDWLTPGKEPHALLIDGFAISAWVLAASENLDRSIVVTNKDLGGGWNGSPLQQWKLYRHDAATDEYELITPPPIGPLTNYYFRLVDFTPDLSSLLIETVAELTPDAVGVAGAKLYRWTDGEFTLMSVVPDPLPPGSPIGEAPSAGTAGAVLHTEGDPADFIEAITGGEILTNALSDDGQVAWFSSPTTTPTLLYRRGPEGTQWVNGEENSLEAVAPGDASFVGASADGRVALFTSEQRLVDGDTDTVADLYRYDSQAAAGEGLTLISADGEPGDSDGPVGGLIGMSDDGSHVYFVADGQLVPGEPAGGAANLYHWSSEGLDFIGAHSDPMVGWPQKYTRAQRALSADGRAFAFVSAAAGLTAEDNGGLAQVYLYDADDSSLVCASCPAGGAAATAGSSFATQGTISVGFDYAWLPNVAAGPSVYFDTVQALDSADRNGRIDVYQWRDGQASLVSTGQDGAHSYLLGASRTGNDVFISTRERLVPWDGDALRDIYDARVGGGLDGPPGTGAPCEGDACQGASPVAPSRGSLGSVDTESRGDSPAGPRARATVLRVGPVALARFARSGKLVMGVRVNRAGRVRMTATARVGSRRQVVGRAARTAKRAGRLVLTVRLSKAARRQLARDRRLRVTVSAAFAGQREQPRARLNLTLGNGKGR